MKKDSINSNIPNRIKNILKFCLGPYIYTDVRINSWYQYGRHHQAPLFPYKEIQVRTENITYKSKGVEIAPEAEIYTHVIGGDWDQDLYLFDEFCPTPSIYQRYNNNRSWEDTTLYKSATEKLNTGSIRSCVSQTSIKSLNAYIDRFESVDDLNKQCEDIDILYNSIKEEGFKSCKERSILGASFRWFRRDNIQVNVGRDGEIIQKDGKHRLAVCKAIGIKKLPVMVVVRHKQWQSIRDEVYSTKYKSNLSANAIKHLDHPDIEYLHNW